jgi:hypothetical protein
MLDCPAKMNILSLPLLAIAGTLGVVGVIGVVGPALAVGVPSGSADPPHAAMAAVIKRALNNLITFRLFGISLLGCIVSFILNTSDSFT